MSSSRSCRTLFLRRPWFVAAALVAVALMLVAGTSWAATVPNPDPCDQAYGGPMDSTEKLRAYTDCRLDRIEKAIPEKTVTAPAATITTTTTVTATVGPVTTTQPSTSPTTRSSTPTTRPSTSPPSPASGTWMSGQSDTGTTANGSFAAWRGRAVDIGGFWASTESHDDAVHSPDWSIGPGAPYANIPAMDYAFGAFLDDAGQSWAAAAGGAYDARWREQLVRLKQVWGDRDPGKMHIRFAHEFNGDWYPWRVAPGDVARFTTAWARWAGLVRQHFPGAKTVWCPNDESSYGYDIRALWPGDAHVDVVAVDQYNWWPWVNDRAAFDRKITATAHGGPKGIETYRQYAASRGKPFALSEWGNSAVDHNGSGGGEAPEWFRLMHEWLRTHGGNGTGQVRYEVLFNIEGYGNRFELFPNTVMPQSAAAYRDLW